MVNAINGEAACRKQHPPQDGSDDDDDDLCRHQDHKKQGKQQGHPYGNHRHETDGNHESRVIEPAALTLVVELEVPEDVRQERDQGSETVPQPTDQTCIAKRRASHVGSSNVVYRYPMNVLVRTTLSIAEASFH